MGKTCKKNKGKRVFGVNLSNGEYISYEVELASGAKAAFTITQIMPTKKLLESSGTGTSWARKWPKAGDGAKAGMEYKHAFGFIFPTAKKYKLRLVKFDKGNNEVQVIRYCTYTKLKTSDWLFDDVRIKTA